MSEIGNSPSTGFGRMSNVADSYESGCHWTAVQWPWRTQLEAQPSFRCGRPKVKCCFCWFPGPFSTTSGLKLTCVISSPKTKQSPAPTSAFTSSSAPQMHLLSFTAFFPRFASKVFSKVDKDHAHGKTGQALFTWHPASPCPSSEGLLRWVHIGYT